MMYLEMSEGSSARRRSAFGLNAVSAAAILAMAVLTLGLLPPASAQPNPPRWAGLDGFVEVPDVQRHHDFTLLPLTPDGWTDFEAMVSAPGYADARVEVAEGALVLTFWDDPDMVANLEHWHHDTFRAVWRNPALGEKFVYFTAGPHGEIDRLHVEWSLRHDFLPVGIYPSQYTRTTVFERTDAPARPLMTPPWRRAARGAWHDAGTAGPLRGSLGERRP
jgi:hypothetical protein